IPSGITIEEFENLPEALAHNHELVNGELVDVSGNTPRHNKLRDRLLLLLTPPVEAQKLGLIILEQEFDFDGNAHGPDVAFIREAKLTYIEPRKRVQPFVPDLAIEIVSNNDRFNDVMEKADRYRACGTKEVWVLAPEIRQGFVKSASRHTIVTENE